MCELRLNMSGIVILAVRFQLKQLKKQPKKEIRLELVPFKPEIFFRLLFLTRLPKTDTVLPYPVLLLSFLMHSLLEVSIKAQNLKIHKLYKQEN